MKPGNRIFTILLILHPLAAGAAGAWAARGHRWVAYQALQVVDRELPVRPDLAWGWIRCGAQDPDRPGPGRIPPEGHVIHITPGPRGEARGKAGEYFQELVEAAAAVPDDDRRLCYELGRICHLVSDLCQPLHTDGRDRRAGEGPVHRAFEALADARVDEVLPPQFLPPPPGPGPPPGYMCGLAASSNRDYDAVMDALVGPRRRSQEATVLLARGLRRSVAETVRVWRWILRRRSRPSPLPLFPLGVLGWGLAFLALAPRTPRPSRRSARRAGPPRRAAIAGPADR